MLKNSSAQGDRVRFITRGEMRDTADLCVNARATQVFTIDILVRDRLHHFGACDKHVARTLDHDREVRNGRRIDRAARTRTHDQRDLRHNSGGQGVAQEDIGVAAQRDDSFLDACAARNRSAQ